MKPPLRSWKQLTISSNGGVKFSAAFWMYLKPSTRYGSMGCLYMLFTELGIQGRMWLAIEDLYTDVKAQVLIAGELSGEFDISQGTGQDRILAPIRFISTAF